MPITGPHFSKLFNEPNLLVQGKQPVGKVKLNKGHPLAKGLVHAFLFNMQTGYVVNLVDGKRYTFNQYKTAVNNVVTKKGRGISTDTTLTGSAIDLPGGDGSDYDPAGRSFSCYHFGSVASSGNFKMMIAKEPGSGTGYFRFNVNTSNVMRLRVQGNVGAANLDGATTCPINAPCGLGFSVENTGTGLNKDVYFDGVNDGSTTSTDTVVDAHDGPAFLNSVAAGNDYDGNSYLQFFWMGRALTDKEHLSIHRDPYQLFESANNSIWLPDAVGASHNLTVLDAVSTCFADDVLAAQDHQLTVSDAQSQTEAEQVALSQNHQLDISDAMAQAEAETVVFAQAHSLTPLPAYSDTFAGDVSLTQDHQLSPIAAVAASFAENLLLTQDHQLSVNNAESNSFAEDVIFTSGTVYNLNVTSAYSAAFAENIGLSQVHQLSIDNAVAATIADDVLLTQNHQLIVSGSVSNSFAEDVIATADLVYNLNVTSAYSVSFAGDVALTQNHQLIVNNAESNSFAEAVFYFLATLGEIENPHIEDLTPGYSLAVLSNQHDLSDLTVRRSVTNV